MNWGTKIVIGLALFMATIVVLGVIMVRDNKKDALVENDYYERGINYDKDYNRQEQVKHDHAQPAVVISKDKITLTFTSEAKGNAQLMRMADQTLDKTLPFQSGTGNQAVIPTATFQKGNWKLILTWASNGKNYLYEQKITL